MKIWRKYTTSTKKSDIISTASASWVSSCQRLGHRVKPHFRMLDPALPLSGPDVCRSISSACWCLLIFHPARQTDTRTASVQCVLITVATWRCGRASRWKLVSLHFRLTCVWGVTKAEPKQHRNVSRSLMRQVPTAKNNHQLEKIAISNALPLEAARPASRSRTRNHARTAYRISIQSGNAITAMSVSQVT